MATFPGGVYSNTVPSPSSARAGATSVATLFDDLYNEVVALETQLYTGGSPQFSSLGVGVAASGTAGRVDASTLVLSGTADVVSLSNGYGLRVRGDSGGDPAYIQFTNNNGGSQWGYIQVTASAMGFYGAASYVTANSTLDDGSGNETLGGWLKTANGADNKTDAYWYRDGTYEMGVQKVAGRGADWFFSGATDFNIVKRATYGTLGGTILLTVQASGQVGIGETAANLAANPATMLAVRKDTAGGRGGELSIVNYATGTVGNEAALNFATDPSTYDHDNGNAQIKAISTNAGTSAADMVFSLWSGSAFNEYLRITSAGVVKSPGGWNLNNVAKQVSGGTTAGVIAGLVALGLFSS